MSSSRARRPPRASSSAALKVGDQADSRMDCGGGNRRCRQVAVSGAQGRLTNGVHMAAPTARCAAHDIQAEAGKQGKQHTSARKETRQHQGKNNGINPPGPLTGWRHHPPPACRASRTAGSAGTARLPALHSSGQLLETRGMAGQLCLGPDSNLEQPADAVHHARLLVPT